MSEMSPKLALNIAITALQPHFSTPLKASSIISINLKKLDDDRLTAIKQDTEDLAREAGYGTRIPFHRLKNGDYFQVINYADEVWAQSWELPKDGGSPSNTLKFE